MVTTPESEMPTVWMIDAGGDKRGLITYTKVTAIARFCEVGTWRVECQLTPQHVRAAAAGWRIIIDDVSGMYGGHVKEAEIVQSGRTRTLTLSGEDDMMWLRCSVAWPTPASGVGSQTVAYDIRTGVASTIIRQYVDVNRGPSSPHVARRLPGLTLAADPVLGDTVTGRARFTNLLELLQGLAVTGGVGFRMVPTIGSGYTFEVYEPPSVTGPARFGLALGNVKSVRWRLTAPEATWMAGGGRGEETARAFVSVTNIFEDDDWGRREDFFDYRSASSTDSNAELLQGTSRRLDEQASTGLVAIEPIDNARLRYGIDYQLGSEVLVEVYGEGDADIYVYAIIREAELTASRSNSGPVRTLTPRVGDIGATATSKQTLAIRDALARIGNLEHR